MLLRIMNETGHTELQVTETEVIEQIPDHPTYWGFVDGEITSREEISEVNWANVEEVPLSPAVVGGSN